MTTFFSYFRSRRPRQRISSEQGKHRHIISPFFSLVFFIFFKTVRLAKDHLLKGYSETAVLIGWPRGGPWERRCLWPRWPRSGARLTSSSRRLGLDIAPIDSQQMSSLLIVFCCGVEGWVRILHQTLSKCRHC